MYELAEIRPSNSGTLTLLCTSLTLFFAGYKSFEGMVSEILSQHGRPDLGSVSLFMAYITFAGCSVLQPYLVQFLHYRSLLALGGMLFGLYILAGFVLSLAADISGPFEVLFCVAAAGKGVGASMIWSGQSGYLKMLLPRHAEGRQTALFWSFMQTSYLWGNLLGALFLRWFSQSVYLLVTLVLVLATSLAMRLLLKDPQADPHLFAINEDARLDQPTSLPTRLSKMREVLVRPQTVTLLPYFVSAGFVIAMNGGFLYILVSECSGIPLNDRFREKELNVLTEYVLLASGAGSFCWGLLLSRLLSNRILYAACYLTQCGLMLWLMGCVMAAQLPSYPMGIVMGLLLGAIDTTNNVALSTITQVDYPNELEAYSLFRIFNPLGVALFYGLALALGRAFLPLVGVVAGMAAISAGSLYRQLLLKGQ